ncbi:hypothetical protein BO94DRAFT_229672 [Aspergillus sclerotioniger CBS 115572]|uniref:Uncharacterized protein n=1 Tax=Aspergillus sclerotioniger CBS 115572 TaxID=1450535 RepID=A0A317VJP3_9EURO|nr:hypothetical protein BO94DRAFT_229672 [Aspergillus sclerotioniger CBS 115572]PWY74553.1 hypothetical protein BO94DRAFT_229672 [Aspergillus sclerotioniger CBS 115572]
MGHIKHHPADRFLLLSPQTRYPHLNAQDYFDFLLAVTLPTDQLLAPVPSSLGRNFLMEERNRALDRRNQGRKSWPVFTRGSSLRKRETGPETLSHVIQPLQRLSRFPLSPSSFLLCFSIFALLVMDIKRQFPGVHWVWGGASPLSMRSILSSW